jgi:ATP-dependent Lon protease
VPDQTPSIFNNTTTASPTQTTQTETSTQTNASVTSDYTDLLLSIKNERGEPKYKSVEDALKGLQHAQNFIPTIKNELDQKEQELERLRAEAARVKTLEETIASLTSQQTTLAPTTSPVIDENKIAELVTKTLTRTQQEQLARENVSVVTSTLQQSFGADAEKKFYEKGAELGMTIQEMNALAAKSPKAVFSMLGIQVQPSSTKTVSPNASTVNTTGLQPQANTFVGRNAQTALIGATTQQLQEESGNARKMVDELHAQGKTVHDLTDPKVYFKFFK